MPHNTFPSKEEYAGTYLRLMRQLTAAKVRAVGRDCIESWCDRAERSEGGLLIFQAPFGRTRDLTEIGFRSEFFPLASAS